jgi:hypothetical protein
MAVIASPATASSISVIVSETCASVVTVTGSLVVCLACGTSLVSAKSTQSTAVLGVQMRISTESLLSLLALKWGKASLRLRLSGHTVSGRAGTVGLRKGGAGPGRLRCLEALRLLRGHRRLLGHGLVLAETSLCAAKYVRHARAKGVGASGGLLGLRRLRGSSAAIDGVTAGSRLVEATRGSRRGGVVVGETVRLAIHTSLAIWTILIAISILSAVRHVVLVIIAASIVVHGSVSSVLLLSHLAHVRSIVRVGVVGISVTVRMSGTLTRHVLRSWGLSSGGEGWVRGVVTAARSIDMAIAAGRLSGGSLGLHLSAGDTETSRRPLSHRGILGLAVGAIVVVREALVNSVERRVFAAGCDSGLDGGLVCEWLLHLGLRLGDLLRERVVRLLGLGVAGKIGERGIGSGDLWDRRKSGSRTGNSRSLGGRLGLSGRR